MAEAELTHVEQLGRIRKEADARVAEALRRAEADIGERLAASTKRILQQNLVMENELQVHIAVRALPPPSSSSSGMKPSFTAKPTSF